MKEYAILSSFGLVIARAESQENFEQMLEENFGISKEGIKYLDTPEEGQVYAIPLAMINPELELIRYNKPKREDIN